MGKRERKSFDSLASRILFFEIGAFFLGIAAFIAYTNPLTSLASLYGGGGFMFAGVFCLFCSISLSSKTVTKWAEKTGNHEILIVFVLVAFGLASLFKSKKNAI